MRGGALLAILLLGLPGCAWIQAVLTPPRPPAPATSAPAPTTPPTPGAPAPGVPSAPLVPQMSTDQERRLREDAERRLDESDRLLRQFQGRPLPPKERETYLLAQSFLEQARKALAAKEYERAANLAAKARTLTDDLAATPK